MPKELQSQRNESVSRLKAVAEVNLKSQASINSAILSLALGPQNGDVTMQINELWTKLFALNVELNLHCQREIQNAQGS
jgi:hypothetical protein